MNSKKNLVIVESPAKAKTIEKFLGKDYSVKSSFGHIRDLPKKGLNINIENNFEPNYQITDDKKKIVRELKKDAKDAEMVWLASDEDREGEAIAWHLSEALQLNSKKTKRIVFHEITESAIKNAIANPRQVDIDLVNAQQARRVLDRLVGYELSPVLWKKVRPGLSAGRVQSVAVKLIVEREREIRDFTSQISYKVSAIFNVKNQTLNADLNTKLDNESTAQKFLEDCEKETFTVINIDQKPGFRNPGAPFTTSTLQQEAARKLGFSVKQTMTLAQRLYENGHITYMRTDSTNLSTLALSAMQDYIIKSFGSEYAKQRTYKTKDASAQEAHEAIRPTHFNKLQAGDDHSQQKLYQLIWKRAIASQMAAAKTLRTTIDINISNRNELFIAKGEILQFDGFLKVYGGGKDDTLLPPIKVNEKLEFTEINARQSFSRAPARYSEGSLVKTLEELGIGRPSTYAPTINTIQSRGYIEKADLEGAERTAVNLCLKNNKISKTIEKEQFGADKGKLFPTDLADVTTDFLVKHFSDIVDSHFTARAEKQLDEIAEGKLIWQTSIKDFYNNFKPLVLQSDNISKQEASQARLLGKDPNNHKPIYARFGRYGPMLQRGEKEDEDKPDFAPLPTGTRLETVTLKQALGMFGLPRSVGFTDDGQEIKANIGRFGPYIVIDKLFVSIKPLDPFLITESEAKELYNKKLETIQNRVITSFGDSNIQILRGPYGPYITDGTKNARIAKDTDPLSINLATATELLKNAKPSKKRKIRTRK